MSLWTNQAVTGLNPFVSGTWVGAYTVLTDASDATSLKKTSAGSGDTIAVYAGAPTIPANEVLTGVRWRLRRSCPSAFSTFAINTSLGPRGVGSGYAGVASIATLTGPWRTTNITGVPLSASDLTGLSITLNDRTTSAAAATLFVELGIDVQTASVPTVTVSSPSGTVADNLAPPIVWAHSDYTTATVTNKELTGNVAKITTSAAHGFVVGNDVTVALTTPDAVFDGTYKITAVTSTTFSYARTNVNVGVVAAPGTATIGDGNVQTAYEVKVFTAAQYGAGGFSPSTSTPTWSTSGTGTTSTVTPAQLANSTTFRAYVRTTKTSALGRAVQSAWAFVGFTTSATPPPAPAVAATFDATTNRCSIIVQNGGNLLPANDSTAESGVGTWAALTNMGAPTASATVAFHGLQSVRMSSTAAGTMTMRTASGTSGVAVIAGQAYSILAQVRAGSVARTNRVGVQFYDSSGVAVGGIVYGTGVTSATGAWTAASLLTTAPTGAAYAAAVIEVQSTAAGAELHYADAIGICPGGAASSPNLITSDPSFEGGSVPAYVGTGWIGSTPSTIATSGTQAFTGSQSLLVTLASASAALTGAQVALTGLTIGATYTLSVYVRVPSGGSPRVVLFDIFGATSGLTYTTRDTGATTNAWVRLIVTFTATGTVHYFAVANDAAATAGHSFHMDAVQLEVGTSASAFSVPGVTTWSPGGRTYAIAIVRTVAGVSTTVRGASALVPDSTGRVSTFDYEAPRGASVTYSATVTATATGAATTSATGASTALTPSNDGRYWLKSMTNPALNLGGIRITGTPQESVDENLGTFRLDGRTDTVVVAGQIYGDDPDLTITTIGAAEYEAVRALVKHQGTLLLQEPFYDSTGVGRQRWVRVVDRSWTRDGVPERPRSLFTVKALEVGRGY